MTKKYSMIVTGVLMLGVLSASTINVPESTPDAGNNAIIAITSAEASKSNSLEENLRNIIGNENYSVYVEYPASSDGSDIVINDGSFRSASMIKVFIMSYAMQKVADGELTLDKTVELTSSDKVGGAGIIAGWEDGTVISVETLLEYMITESDNTATNMLIDLLGMNNINSYLVEQNYSATVLKRHMMDTEAAANGLENMSSAKDLGQWFSRVYRHNCVNDELDSKMISILLRQSDTDGIPEAAGDSYRVAHKTGELDAVCDDGGILYGGNGDAIIVVMDDGVGRGDAIEAIHNITRAVLD